jgi:hypothetical protein
MNTNRWKIVAILLTLVAVVALLAWGPSLSGNSDPGPDVRLPSMENIPPNDQRMKIELQPESSASRSAEP